MRTGRATVVILSFLLVSCGKDTATAPPRSTMSDSARSYLTEALDIMQRQSINKYKLDWTTIRANAMRQAATARTYSDTYAAIAEAVLALGDHHSHFYPPATEPPPGIVGGGLSAGRIRGRVGYVAIPGLLVGDPAALVAFADSLQNLIASADTTGLCGWVVDLRKDVGGAMYPMIAGAGPILGEGDLGMFVDADGNRQIWYQEGGAAGVRPAAVLVRVTPPRPYLLRRPNPRAAVLTGEQTASAGEAVAISFRGRPDTRSFGAPTAGRSTGNLSFRLRDGAALVVTGSIAADRQGTLYGSQVLPDSFVAEMAGTDAPLAAAVAWVETAPVCR